MTATAISLGWNCYSASMGVSLGYRKTKASGYKTCPFDEMNTNYNGLVLCLQEGFRHFCDPSYLRLQEFPSTDTYYPNETLIVNTRYGFIFNHESPGHANLFQTQAWPGGINHYVDNNYEKFIERYQRRISNFYNYIRSDDVITFLITYPDNEMLELRRVLDTLCLYNLVRFDIQDVIKYSDHLELMQRISSPLQISNSHDNHQTDSV